MIQRRRTHDNSKRVEVYFNLHKRCWSVRQNGLVIAHVDDIAIRDATFKVLKSGRERVLRERKKNVHAFVAGYWVDRDQLPEGDRDPVKYNPYKDQTFVRIDGKQKVPVRQARDVIMTCHDNSSPTVVAAGCTEL